MEPLVGEQARAERDELTGTAGAGPGPRHRGSWHHSTQREGVGGAAPTGGAGHRPPNVQAQPGLLG